MFEKMLRELQSMQGQIEVVVPLEADAEGYLDRECPAEACLFTFKVYGDDWHSLVKEAEVFCPMCRHRHRAGAGTRKPRSVPARITQLTISPADLTAPCGQILGFGTRSSGAAACKA